MAAGHSLPPIDLPRDAAVQRKLRRLGGFGVGATAIWLCLIGMGASQPLQAGSGNAPEKAASSCKLKQKKPLFVGFAEGMQLDSFETSALAARDIVHEVKRWTCDDTEKASRAVSSLQLAFARHEPLRLDLVQFDDPSMERAHVLLSQDRDARSEPRWRVDLIEQSAGWTISRSRLATAGDIAEERASRRK
jgi:hypothetical protein